MENLVSMDLFKGFYKGKRILVTGDTGFKGSWLSIWLQKLGAEVFGFSLPPEKELENYVICGVSSLINHEDGDIRNFKSLNAYIQKIKPEIVFHLAAQAIVLESYDDPINTYDTNVMGTVNLIESCRKCDSVRTMVIVTSDKCYENNDWVWGYRETDTLGGKDPYSASKACVELVCKSYRDSMLGNGNIALATVRAGNVIGAGDWADNRIVPDFFRSYKNDTTMNIRNPSSTRPWQHVLEPLSGYLLLGSKLSFSNRYNEAWNFGPLASSVLQVKDIVDILLNMVPVTRVCFAKSSGTAQEASNLNLDVSKAKSLLSWVPRMSMRKALELTANGYLSDIEGKPALENRMQSIVDYVSISKDEENEH